MDITNKIDQFLDEAYEKVKGTKMKNGKFYSDFMEVKKAFTDAKDAKEYYTAAKAALEFIYKAKRPGSGYDFDALDLGDHRLIISAEKDLIKLSIDAIKRLKLSDSKKITQRDIDDLKPKDVLKRIMTTE